MINTIFILKNYLIIRLLFFFFDMLNYSSSTITQHIKNDPGNLCFHLDIIDEHNALSKFEKKNVSR